MKYRYFKSKYSNEIYRRKHPRTNYRDVTYEYYNMSIQQWLPGICNRLLSDDEKYIEIKSEGELMLELL
jgi:hypothetical protein